MKRVLFSVLAAAAILAGCHGSTHSNRSADVSKANVAAAAADKQLTKDGYSALHVPGFGKVDVGIKSLCCPRYEAIYTYTGKDSAALKDMVANAQSKLADKKTVSVHYIGNLVVMQANNLHSLKDAVKAVLTGGKS